VEKQGLPSQEDWKMNRVIRGLKATFCLVKAWLGLPYMPMGILVLLALTWFNRPPDLILTATLLFALPVSWLCRLQCEREQRFYKKLYLDSERYLQAANSTKASRVTAKSCPVCSRTISSENNFCSYCGTDLGGQKFNNSLISQKQA
jgi:hypothetical protein